MFFIRYGEFMACTIVLFGVLSGVREEEWTTPS